MRLIDADALLEASCYEFWQDASAITPIGEYILARFRKLVRSMPTIEPERCQLTDDDKETIRIHLNAIKEELCNQHRWNEAKEYEELIDRLMDATARTV